MEEISLDADEQAKESAWPLAIRMMSNARRITCWKRAEIGHLFKRSRRVYTSIDFDVRIAPALQESGKILLIVPRAAGNAPDRNTFKRRIKALFYQEQIYQKGYDWIVFAKKKGLSLTFADLKKAVLNVMQKLPAKQPSTSSSSSSP